MKFDTQKKGIYIILDMRTFNSISLRKLDHLLSYQIIAVQVWDNNVLPIKDLMVSLVEVVHAYNIPILINNRYNLLQEYDFDGVHFDDIPANWDSLQSILKNKIIGVTCTNDMDIVEWATAHKVDYLSFCSMFPSENNTRCVLVNKILIKSVQQKYTIPFFLAGGISPQNVKLMDDLNFSGIAIVSEIMKADNPKEIINEYYLALNKKL